MCLKESPGSAVIDLNSLETGTKIGCNLMRESQNGLFTASIIRIAKGLRYSGERGNVGNRGENEF